MKVFVPAWTRLQFVKWVDKKHAPNKHRQMKKNQLIAIYINS